MSIRSALAACIALFAAAPVFGATYLYEVTGAGTAGAPVTPYSSAQSVKDFYNYGGASANLPTDISLSERQALFLLHLNTLTDDLSLVVVFDKIGGAKGRAEFSIAGAPDTATIAVRDEGKEVADVVNGAYKFSWVECCTDGFAASGLGGQSWSVVFSPMNVSGISSFQFLNGDGTHIALGDLTTTGLTLTATPVPLPAGIWLLAGGVAALAAARRRA